MRIMNFCKRNKKRRQRALGLGLGLGLGLWGSNSKLRLLYGAMRENLDQLSQRLPLAYTALHRIPPSSPTCPPLYRRQTAGSTVREIIAVSKDSEIVANPTTTDNLRSDAENLKGLYCVIIVRNRKEIVA